MASFHLDDVRHLDHGGLFETSDLLKSYDIMDIDQLDPALGMVHSQVAPPNQQICGWGTQRFEPSQI